MIWAGISLFTILQKMQSDIISILKSIRSIKFVKNDIITAMLKKYSLKEKVSDDLVEQLLHNRGIYGEEEKEKFLNPNFEKHLHDPFLLPDMERAASRVIKAMERGEKIGIWTDYDADGIPGGALLHDFLKLTGFNNFVNYIPDRQSEGYGLNMDGMERLKEEKIKLLITVDCGIRDHKQIERANELGIEVIVTDHHEPGEELPKAFAIINPKLVNSRYPEKILCGTGVIWKLVEAILQKKRNHGQPFNFAKGKEKWLLDLVGLATLSDMVPLTGENRVIAHYGLKVLRKTRRPGLLKLYYILRMNRSSLTEDDIAFLITPRINAASRMGKPRDAFELLTTTEEGRGEILARHLDSINHERKGVVASIVKEAKKHIIQRFENHGEKSVIVVGNPEWQTSLLGLAANTIAEEFNRPVFLWGRPLSSSGILKGSCRSDGSTDLVALMKRANGHFLEFGGHKLSGGFSVDFDKIHTLENALIEASSHTVKAEEECHVDAELKLKDVNEEVATKIIKLAPFGIGNEKPVFLFYNIIAEKVSRFGKGKEHLEVTLRDGQNTAKAIQFFGTPEDWGQSLQEGRTTNLAASIEKSSFGGRNEIRLRIVDFF